VVWSRTCGLELAAEFVEDDHNVEVLLRVNTGDDTPVVVCDGGHATPFLGLWGGMHGRVRGDREQAW
jgi:hypothetical protein